MSSRNPVLGKIKAPVVSDAELARIVNGPGVAGQVTFTSVIIRTAMVFSLLVVGFAYGWATAESHPSLMTISMFVGFGLAMANIFVKKPSAPLVLLYGAVEGIFIGAISRWFDAAYGPGIVQQAVLGTLVAFGVMLALYKSQIVKVDGKFKKVFATALMSYFFIGIASFISSFFGVGKGWGFYGVGQIGLLLCLAGVGIAAFSLMMDFEVVTSAVASGMPEEESWRLAFGLIVSLVWLYTEILRLLAILNRR